MNFILLTHSRELTKRSNTGRLALEALGSRAKRVVWQRKVPDESLLHLIDEGGVVLLYPDIVDTDLQTHANTECFTSCIIIDGTWQEARKIYNRSDYLHPLPRLSLNPVNQSKFRLRRNQRSDGLSTVETVIEILKLNQEQTVATSLSASFDDFQNNYSKLLKTQLPKDF